MYLSKSCNRTSILSNKCCSKTNNIVNFNPKEKYYQKIIEELLILGPPNCGTPCI